MLNVKIDLNPSLLMLMFSINPFSCYQARHLPTTSSRVSMARLCIAGIMVNSFLVELA